MGKIIELAPTVYEDDVIARKGEYSPDFKVYTAGIAPDKHNPRLVHMVGSSTERDMQGDVMSLYALNDMTKAPENMTIWLNHNYDLPGSIFGSVVGTPRIMQQDGVADLHLAVDVETDNPAAQQVKKYIDNGRRLGCSIGCMVTKYEIPDESDGPDWQKQPIKILGVYVVEYSVVGIPCNQRSWVENAIRGVFTRTLDPALAPAMKALWPSRYKSLVKSLNVEKQEELNAVPERPRPDSRIQWHAPSRNFLLEHQGKESFMTPDSVKALFAGKQFHSDPVAIPDLTDDLTGIHVTDLEEEDLDVEKGVCGKTSWPLDMDSSWDKGSAHHRLLEWAGGKENFSASKFKSVHFWYDNDGSKISDFHYPFCDIKDGKVYAIWHAIVAAAAALGGARSGTDSGGHGAIRSRLATYYRKAGKPIPWEGGDGEKDGEKSLDDLEITEKNEGTSELDKVAASDNKKKPKPTDKNPDPDHDGDDDRTAEGDTDHDYHKAPKGKKRDDNEDGEDDAADQSSDDEEDDGKDGKGKKKPAKGEKAAEVDVTKELPEHTLALLASFNMLGKSLGIPELTVDQYQEGVTYNKAAPPLPAEHASKMQMIHDMVCGMTNGSVCANSTQQVPEAEARAAEISGQQPSTMPMSAYNSLAENVQILSKSVEAYSQFAADLNAAKATIKELEMAQKQVTDLSGEVSILTAEITKARETVEDLKDMPLGNPLHHQRTVHEADRESTAQRNDFLNINKSQAEIVADDSLKAALALTKVVRKSSGDTVMQYRSWPAGVGGTVAKGVRPALTSNQIMFMDFADISAYREGKAADVPYLDNQIANSATSVTPD